MEARRKAKLHAWLEAIEQRRCASKVIIEVERAKECGSAGVRLGLAKMRCRGRVHSSQIICH